MSSNTNSHPIDIDDIEVPAGGRELRLDSVADLAKSMEELGQLSPIGVRIVSEKPHIVFGRHRLAAARRLRWTKIDCRIVEGGHREARMAEIAENLHRAELTVLERADQTDEWIRLGEEAILAQPAQKLGPGRPEGGIRAAAREIGIDRDAARRAQRIASLPAEAKIAAQELGLDDNQSAMLTAAKAPDPVASLQAHARRVHTPQEVAQRKAEREEEKIIPEKMKKDKEEFEAKRATAVALVADLLVDRLGDRLEEWIDSVAFLDDRFLMDTTIDIAIVERRPDLHNSFFDDDHAPSASHKTSPHDPSQASMSDVAGSFTKDTDMSRRHDIGESEGE